MNSFHSFTDTNSKFWGSLESENNFIVLVDLCHSNINYLLRSLLIAKYVQVAQGGKLVGLLGQTGVVPRSCGPLDVPMIEKLARSYGLSEFWYPPSLTDVDLAEAVSLINTLNAEGDLDLLSPEQLRHQLATLELTSGFPIGRFIYDTTLRAELRATVERVDAPLRHWAADCLSLHRWINQKITSPALTFVTGHLDYNPWGLVGEVVRRNGGEVFWFRLEHNVPIYRIKAAAGALNASYHAIEAEWFHSEIIPFRNNLAAASRTFVNIMQEGSFHQRWTTSKTVTLPASAASSACSAWRRACGWDENNVIVGIFGHAYSDQPLADTQVFSDRYQWLARTVAFAARHPERYWIIKFHPKDQVYDQTGASAELMRRFSGHQHLCFIQSLVASGMMEAVCDVGVTIMGAPGLEMAVAGRPVIVAGNGPYAGCDFVHRALSLAEYESLLLADLSTLRMSENQIELARLYAFSSRVAGSPSSSLLYAIDTPASDAFWQLTEARMRQHFIPSDDLFEAIRCMVKGDKRRCIKPVVDRYFQKNSAGQFSRRLRLPLLEDAPLIFGSGGSGVSCLLSGFASPEAWGCWVTEEIACIGVGVHGIVAVDSIIFTLRYPFTIRSIGSTECGGALPEWKNQTLSIYTRSSCLIDHIDLEASGSISFSVPIKDLTEDQEVLLVLKLENVHRASDLGYFPDDRRLSLALHSIEGCYGSASA